MGVVSMKVGIVKDFMPNDDRLDAVLELHILLKIKIPYIGKFW